MSVSDRLASLTPEQRALFEALRARQQKAAPRRPPQPPPVPRRTGPTAEGDWPLSFDQERLWALCRANPESTANNIDAGSRLHGSLDLGAIAASLDEIVRRHAALRTTFPLVEGRPVQRIAARRRQHLALLDVSGLPAGRREPAAEEVLFHAIRAPFDLENGPVMRTCLLRLDRTDHICLLVIHHLATDWITFQTFFYELAQLYGAVRDGHPSPLPEPGLQYPDYVLWQRDWLQGEALQAYLDWWRERLKGFPQVLELPADRPRPPVPSGNGDRYMISAGRERTQALWALARREGTTPFIAVLAILDVVFHRLSGQERIVVATNTANRARAELEPVVGFFLTQLPFPVDLAGNPTFREILARAHKSAIASYAHQDLPFAKLVEIVQPEFDPGVIPFVQALLLVLDPQYHKLDMAGLTFEALSNFDAFARYDLLFGAYDEPEGLLGPLEYSTDLYDASTIARWVQLFYITIDAAVADPERRLADLPVLPEPARQQVLVEWNGHGAAAVLANLCGKLGIDLADASVHLLDGEGQPVAPGGVGEIWIEGPGLTRLHPTGRPGRRREDGFVELW
ncbi:MAG TPA: condensation domain-containing protein [Thermoanaerobaculia bacterium]|nr:condensation domain-containing protein [Thermoanaerobaculia bacterium]